jgi:hypothetical protein
MNLFLKEENISNFTSMLSTMYCIGIKSVLPSRIPKISSVRAQVSETLNVHDSKHSPRNHSILATSPIPRSKHG